MNKTSKGRLLTNVYLVRGDEVLLGMKKQKHKKSFGVGKWNGFGGKIESGETSEQAAIRECQEECNVTPIKPNKVAKISFIDEASGINDNVDVYLCDKWDGEPQETDEMIPKWFKKDSLPFENMWSDDVHWMKEMFAGKKFYAKVTMSGAGALGEGKDKTEDIEFNFVDEIID